jgi:hypothetical protein
MSNGSRIVYTPRWDATPEDELSALASVYEFILRCAEERRKAGSAHSERDTLSLHEKEKGGQACSALKQ